jgi:hypothetical protein
VITDVSPSGLELIGEVGDFVVFSAGTLGQPTSYSWDIDGVTPETQFSTDPQPIVELLTPGVHIGDLSIENACGGLVDSDDDGVPDPFPFAYEIADCPRLEILDVTPRAGLPGQVVTFQPAVIGSPRTFEWNFDGGATPNAPFEQDPTVTLGEDGTYAAFFEVTDACGRTDRFDFTLFIPCPPLEILDVSPTEGTSGEVVTFQTFSAGLPETFSWNFGGGATPNTSSEEEPTVTLGANGTYPSYVQMTDACGNSDRLDFDLVVGDDVPYYTRTYQGIVTEHLVLGPLPLGCSGGYFCSRATTGSFQGNFFRTEVVPGTGQCSGTPFRANPLTFLPTGWSDPYSLLCGEGTSVGVVNGDQLQITAMNTHFGEVVGCGGCNGFMTLTFTGTAIQ